MGLITFIAQGSAYLPNVVLQTVLVHLIEPIYSTAAAVVVVEVGVIGVVSI